MIIRKFSLSQYLLTSHLIWGIGLMESFKNKRVPLRIDLVTIFLIVLASTVSFIVIYSYQKNTDAILEQSRNSIISVSNFCIGKTRDYLNPAAVLSKMSSSLVENDVIGSGDWDKLEKMSLAIIKEYPQLAMFNYGDQHGNFLMIKKMPDETLATKIVNRNANKPTVTWKYRDRNEKVIKVDISKNVKYDPRVRPWYIAAVANKQICWSNLYLFFTDHVPGISASYPIINPKGKIVGALGFDITLAELSSFLNTVNISENAELLVINEQDKIVACINAKRAMVEKNGKMVPGTIDNLDNPWLKKSFEIYKKNGKENFNFEYKGECYLASYQDFSANAGKKWKFVVVVPEMDFTASLIYTNRITMLVSMVIMVLGIILVIIFSNLVSRSLSALTRETVKIKDFDLSHDVEIETHISEIGDMAKAIKSMKKGLQAFQKYVPSALVRDLIKSGNDARLGGESRELTIFFSDIAGFTTITENMQPQELMIRLSEYLTLMTEHIRVRNGTVDKFIGDSIMAFWNAPNKIDGHPRLACRAALGCRKIVEQISEKWVSEGKMPFYTRIGLHTGSAVVGNLGSSDRMNYTAVGDAVNLASRLEGVNKIYGTSIIVSEETYEQVKSEFIFRELDTVAVKGRQQGVKIYELIEESGMEIDSERLDFIKRFHESLEEYKRKNWLAAEELFKSLSVAYPEDLSVQLYLKRCQDLVSSPPGLEWTGIYSIKTK